MTPKIAARMTEHIAALASEHGITVHWTRSQRSGECFPEEGTVFTPRIRRPAHYYLALHELGHCVDAGAYALTNEAGRYAMVLCEGAAWAWAAETAKPSLLRHLRKADWDLVGYWFRSYLDLRKE